MIKLMMGAALAALTTGCATVPTQATLAAEPKMPTATEISVPGPEGALAGTLLSPAAADAPLVLIVPGSGPTDRDGNNPLGVAAASYRLLAEALATRGIASARIDKRGMFASKGAIADANAATIGGYADDVAAWARMLTARTGRDCIWVAGHSEGGLVALAAAADRNVCGLILIASPGRTIDVVIREQLAANPANAPLLADANAALDRLARGERVDVADMHPALAQGLFNPAVQGFLIDMMARDPAAMIAATAKPVLIVSGAKDLQVARANADALKAAQPRAELVVIDGMNHVLKQVAGDDRAANMASYADPALPIDPTLVAQIARFVAAGAD